MLRPESKKRSFIWRHFNSVVDGQIVECKHCLKPLSINGNSLGNLGRHMRTRHPLILSKSLGSSVELSGGTFDEQYFDEYNMTFNVQRKCVKECGGYSKLYHFPVDEKRNKEWKQLLNVEGNNRQHLYACQRHFSSKMMNRALLIRDAVPDINLSHNVMRNSLTGANTDDDSGILAICELKKLKEQLATSSSLFVPKSSLPPSAATLNDSRTNALGISESSKAIKKAAVQQSPKTIILKPSGDKSTNIATQKTTGSATATNFFTSSHISNNPTNDTTLDSVFRLLTKMNTTMQTGFAELTSRLDAMESSMEACRHNITELRAEQLQLSAQLSSAVRNGVFATSSVDDPHSDEDTDFIEHIHHSFPIDNEETLSYYNNKLADKKTRAKFAKYMSDSYVESLHDGVSVSFKDHFFSRRLLPGEKKIALQLFPYVLAAFHECIAITHTSMPPRLSLQAMWSCCNNSLYGFNSDYEERAGSESAYKSQEEREVAEEDVSMVDKSEVVLVKTEQQAEACAFKITELEAVENQPASATPSPAMHTTSQKDENNVGDSQLIDHIQRSFPIDAEDTLIYYNNKLADKKTRTKFAKYMSQTYVESLHVPPSANVGTYFIDYFFTRRFLLTANHLSPSVGGQNIGLNAFPHLLQAFHECIAIAHPTLPYLDSLRVIWACCNNALHGLNTEVNTLPLIEMQSDYMDQSECSRVCEAAEKDGSMDEEFETVDVKCEAD